MAQALTRSVQSADFPIPKRNAISATSVKTPSQDGFRNAEFLLTMMYLLTHSKEATLKTASSNSSQH